ncbi:hypothetical protein [Verrucomicrobium sp. BvORR106]|uniref:hypothetical protein n=1 Tax=Verrucomicrobium sp. BvORR106 TaxID=1403819 RepID=UPI0005707476|nr:hypothetical protein [Verrucomicrobium sp. BvORR106]
MASEIVPAPATRSRVWFETAWPWLKRIVPWLLVLLPAILLNRLIQEHKVNIPFLDDWMFVHMDAKLAEGTLRWQDFFMVQMEHRMAFVRGVIMLFHHFSPGNYTGQMWLSWVLLALTLVNVGVLLRKTTGAPFRVWWPLLALASVALFSPVHYRIVLWAMMFQVICPAFFLSLAMVLLLSRWPLWIRFIGAVLCAQCATQCFATGILVWVLMIPMILWSGAIPKTQSRYLFLIAWIGVFLVTMGLYFHDLKNETDPQFSYKQGEEQTMGRNFSSFFKNPGKGLEFVVRFLGCHLGRGWSVSVMDASLLLGGLSLALVAAFSLLWLKKFKDETLRQRLLPWLLFGGYSVGAAVLTAVGRSWASQSGDNAIHARYTIHAVPLTISLVVLVWMVSREIRHRRPQWSKVTVQTVTAGAYMLVVVQAVSWTFGERMMAVWESSRLRGAANTLFFNTVYNTEGDIAGNRDLARKANELNLLNPPMLKNARLDNFSLTPKLLNQNTAFFRSCVVHGVDGEAEAVVEGFACLPNRIRVADAVIFAYKDKADGHWEIFHVCQVMGMPLYLVDLMARDLQFVHTPPGSLEQEGLAGFRGSFSFQQLPAGEHRIMAWALDYKSQRVYPMSGFFEVDTVKKRVKKLGSDPKEVNLHWFLEKGKGNPNWEQLK